MTADLGKWSDRELRLKFAIGSSFPFAIREVVSKLRARTVILPTCMVAVLLAFPGGGAFSPEVPLWARIVLNLCSVGLFAVLFPALLQEAHSWAERRGIRTVHEPLITFPAAIITTLTIQALAVFVVGHSDLTRWELAVKLSFGALFWHVHVTMMLLFIAPVLSAGESVMAEEEDRKSAEDVEIPIGNTRFWPLEILRIETDDHFLIVHTASRTVRVLETLSVARQHLEPFGIQVHRSHWVAYGELGEVRRNGRSLLMKTRSGVDVPVARDRRKAVSEAMATGVAA